MNRSLVCLVALFCSVVGAAATRGQSIVFPAGLGSSFSNLQDSLAMNYFIQQYGQFPSSAGSISDSFMIGNVRLSAAVNLRGGSPADGSLVGIQQSEALYSLIGTTYGGDGDQTFALPNLAGRTAVGAGAGSGLTPVEMASSFGNAFTTLTEANLPPHRHLLPPFDQFPPVTTEPDPAHVAEPFSNLQPSLGMNYLISVEAGYYPIAGSSDSVFLGQVGLFASDVVPNGWLPADGRLLAITQNSALFSLLGTTYGGDGQNTFALPDLRGRTIVGAGTSPERGPFYLGDSFGRETTQLNFFTMPAHNHVLTGPDGDTVVSSVAGNSEPLDNVQPSLVLNYGIVAQGVYPSYGEESVRTTMGEIISYAGFAAPEGILPCDGRTLNIAENGALFSLLGTTYGGDGVETFALPDLVGRTVVGAGEGFDLGTVPALLAARSSLLSDEECDCDCDPVYAPGDTPGDSAPRLSLSNLPPHNHSVPEPSTLALAGLGLIGALALGRRRS